MNLPSSLRISESPFPVYQGTDADVDTFQVTAALSYDVDTNVTIFGGVRAQRYESFDERLRLHLCSIGERGLLSTLMPTRIIWRNVPINPGSRFPFVADAVAGSEVMPGVEHRRHKGLNNRAENSHQPTRRREKIMKRFKSARQLQRFVSIHDPIANLFHFPRHAPSSSDHRDLRSAAMATWHEITHIAAA